MKFALFFLGEYVHMITTSFLVVTLFFGGWELPWVAVPGPDDAGTIILKLIVLSVKMVLFICLLHVRALDVPRFRFDQLMGLAWKVLMPLALVNVVVVLMRAATAAAGRLQRLADYAGFDRGADRLRGLQRHAAAAADASRSRHGSTVASGDHAVTPGARQPLHRT